MKYLILQWMYQVQQKSTVNTWVVTALQLISTPSFITVDIFPIVVLYIFLFAFFLHENMTTYTSSLLK